MSHKLELFEKYLKYSEKIMHLFSLQKNCYRIKLRTWQQQHTCTTEEQISEEIKTCIKPPLSSSVIVYEKKIQIKKTNPILQNQNNIEKKKYFTF